MTLPTAQSKPKKQEPVHTDRLGRTIALGDCVAFPCNNSLYIGIVTKVNPKMLRIKHVSNSKTAVVSQKYSYDCVKLDGAEATLYLLKYQK